MHQFFGKESAETPKRTSRVHRRTAFVTLFIATVIFNWVASYSGVLDVSESRATDLFFRLRNQIETPAPPTNIVMVAIDEASMQEFKLQWPWPRGLHADLASALHEAGAAVIAFDVLFVEPTDQDEDLNFARALEKAGNVILAEDFDIVEESQYRQETQVLPLPLLQEAARNTGLVPVSQDPDGFVRKAYLEQRDTAAFSRVIAETYRGARGGLLEPDDPVTTFNLPVDLSEPLVINYLGIPRSIKTVSYYQALDYRNALPEGIFQDKIIIIGRNLGAAPNLDVVDHFPYPFLSVARAQIPGPEIHATLVDMLLRERYLRHLPPGYQSLIFIAFLGVGAFLLWRFRHWKGAIFFLAVVAGFGLLQFLLFLKGQTIANVVIPVSALIIFFVAERVYGYAIVDKEKRFIQHAFGHYVSPTVVNRLVENPEQLNLYGEYCETTVLFTDLVGFTTLSEKMEPMELRKLLTEYFGEMVDAMQAQSGTLDKFIGDAMMCFFGVPIATPGHAKQATMAAWDMQVRLKELNADWSTRGLPTLGMRIGINSGRVVAGNMGTRGLFNYTIMGDPVNLGARLESANKQYGTSIMMGETTFALAEGEFDTRKLDRIRVKGKDQPVVVYELLGPKGAIGPQQAQQVGLYESAFDAYLKRAFEDSISKLDALQRLGPDRPAEILKERCLEYLQSPPAPGWDGVYTMKTK